MLNISAVDNDEFEDDEGLLPHFVFLFLSHMFPAKFNELSYNFNKQSLI